VPNVHIQLLEYWLLLLVENGFVEMKAVEWDDVVDEMTREVLMANSLEDAMARVVEALIDSEHVEEVYGEDEEIKAVLRSALDVASDVSRYSA
jgi:hypothetical protein